jgi:hypothetical protein
VPWLIGKFALRDMALRTASGVVYNIAARQNGTYFLSDWLAGCASLLLIAGTVVAIGRWRNRTSTLITSALLFGLVLGVIIPTSLSSWAEAEQQTAGILESTSPPNIGSPCGPSATFTLEDAHGSATAWTIAGGDGCHSLEIYKGWKHQSPVQLPRGLAIGGVSRVLHATQETYSIVGDGTVGGSAVIGFASNGEVFGFPVSNSKAIWRFTGGSQLNGSQPPFIVASAGMDRNFAGPFPGGRYLYIPRRLETHQAYVDVVDTLRGKIIGQKRVCPSSTVMLGARANADGNSPAVGVENTSDDSGIAKQLKASGYKGAIISAYCGDGQNAANLYYSGVAKADLYYLLDNGKRLNAELKPVS